MPENLIERYNHLHHKNHSEGEKGFVDFLYEKSDFTPPEVDLDKQWAAFNRNLNQTRKSSNTWMKVAASLVILVGVCVATWNYLAPDELTIATTDKKMNVTFPDGSKGILNTNSSFSFLEKFGDERNVAFTGEAFFDITKSKKPFIINTGDIEVRVLGTAFNLSTNGPDVELYVERGLVAFEKEGEQTHVEAGWKATFNKSTSEIAIDKTPSLNSSSWSTGLLEFDNTLMSEVINDLESYYDVHFELVSSDIESCTLTATFDNEPVEEVLKTIESVLSIQSELSNDQVLLSGTGC